MKAVTAFCGDGRHFLLTLENGMLLDVDLDVLPLSPKLKSATAEQRRGLRLIGGGSGIQWPLLDEDLSVDGVLRDCRVDRILRG